MSTIILTKLWIPTRAGACPYVEQDPLGLQLQSFGQYKIQELTIAGINHYDLA